MNPMPHKAKEGTKAKDFTLATLDGRRVSLSDFQGKVVLLNFWATWCNPCREELPKLALLQEDFRRRGLVVLLVGMDSKPKTALDYLQKHGIKLPSLWDRKKLVASAYNVTSMPSTYIIDRRGMVRFVHCGYDLHELARMEDEIDTLLDEVIGKPSGHFRRFPRRLQERGNRRVAWVLSLGMAARWIS